MLKKMPALFIWAYESAHMLVHQGPAGVPVRAKAMQK